MNDANKLREQRQYNRVVLWVMLLLWMALLDDPAPLSIGLKANAFISSEIPPHSRISGGTLGPSPNKRFFSARPKATLRFTHAPPAPLDASGNTTLDSSSFLEYVFNKLGAQGEPSDVQLKVCPITDRRGLYVTTSIAEGDYVVALPATSSWIVEHTDSKSAEEEASDAQRGLWFWQWQQKQQEQEQKQTQSSVDLIDWKPYLNILPKLRNNESSFDPTPDFWSEDQIRALELPLAVEKALAKRKRVDDLAASTLESPSNKDLRFSTWLVGSRAMTIIREEEEGGEEMKEIDGEAADNTDDTYETEDLVGLATTCVMVPLLDMINHSSRDPNVYFAVLGDDDDENDNGGAAVDNDDEEGLFYAVVADRDLRAGEELLLSYGTEQDSSVDLLLQYGFVPDENPYDVDFWESYEESTPPKFWTTTLAQDQDRLNKLLKDNTDVTLEESSSAIEGTILRFRIRMKRAHVEWKQQQRGLSEEE